MLLINYGSIPGRGKRFFPTSYVTDTEEYSSVRTAAGAWRWALKLDGSLGRSGSSGIEENPWKPNPGKSIPSLYWLSYLDAYTFLNITKYYNIYGQQTDRVHEYINSKVGS
jgi:hypothetical protein